MATSTTFNEQSLLNGSFTGKNLQVGSENSSTNLITVNISGISASIIGVSAVKTSTQSDAQGAISSIKTALTSVNEMRANLGAVQNRLEHTINNLDNIVENTTSAESAIRDTDMATEMVKYSNNQILAQAGQAMLAQSNQANQGVLSLLQ